MNIRLNNELCRENFGATYNTSLFRTTDLKLVFIDILLI